MICFQNAFSSGESTLSVFCKFLPLSEFENRYQPIERLSLCLKMGLSMSCMQAIGILSNLRGVAISTCAASGDM